MLNQSTVLAFIERRGVTVRVAIRWYSMPIDEYQVLMVDAEEHLSRKMSERDWAKHCQLSRTRYM